MANIVQLIKQAAVEAVEASKPLKIVYGTVISSKPLKIKIDQKITLPEEFLVLTRNVTDYEIETFADMQKIKVHNALKAGEKVILLQEQGGQNYIVLDRVGDGA